MGRHGTIISLERLAYYLGSALPEFDSRLSIDASLGVSGKAFLFHSKGASYLLKHGSRSELDRELSCLNILANGPVPVPAVRHVCLDATIIGQPFIVLLCPGGRYIPELRMHALHKGRRLSVHDDMIRILSDLHSIRVHPEVVQDVGGLEVSRRYFVDELARLRQSCSALETGVKEDAEMLIGWLARSVPKNIDGPVLVHGDFQVENLILHATRDEVVAVLNWDNACMGPATLDLAAQFVRWSLPENCGLSGLGGIDRRKEGFPSEQACIESYCLRRGISGLSDWSYYIAFSYLRLAVNVQAYMARTQKFGAFHGKGSMRPWLFESLIKMGCAAAE